MLVGIADLGIGNFAAMAKMIAQLGGDPRRLTSPSEMLSASHLILPGVGAFDYAADTLDRGGWREPLLRVFADGGRPVLCVCVGMELLVNSSEEGPGAGLGWIPGSCVRFRPPQHTGLKVPHMGWNEVSPTQPSPLFPNPAITSPERYYFCHSYHLACTKADDILATSDYGPTFPAAIGRDNVMGVQFHPEKSHRFGLRLLRSFLDIPC